MATLEWPQAENVNNVNVNTDQMDEPDCYKNMKQVFNLIKKKDLYIFSKKT